MFAFLLFRLRGFYRCQYLPRRLLPLFSLLFFRYEFLYDPESLNYNWPPGSFTIQTREYLRDAEERQRQAKKWNFMVTLEGFGRKLLFRVSTGRSSSEGRAPSPFLCLPTRYFNERTSPITHPPSIHTSRPRIRPLSDNQPIVRERKCRVRGFASEIGFVIFQSSYIHERGKRSLSHP